MTVRDVGDGYAIEYQARDPDGTLVSATVALSLTDPSGNTSTVSPTNPSTGIYRYTIDLDEAGVWRWVWTVTGNVQDKAYGDVFAQSPAPAIYASVAELRRRMSISDGASDDELLAALQSTSREIDKFCGRRFYSDPTASARVFYPDTPCLARVDDFHTSTGLVVAVDYGDDGTYETTLAASEFQLEPLNGVVDGEAGWPYNRIRTLLGRTFPTASHRAPVQVTAKWGWASVPDPVKQACLILAGETFKLAEAPWGVANMDQFGPIRVRQNPLAMSKLGPYRIWPVLVA